MFERISVFNLSELLDTSDFGHYFSVNSAMIESSNGQKIIDRILPSQLLTETDGPFVKVGSRAVEPRDINLVERYLALRWSVSRDIVGATIRENFIKIVTPIRTLFCSLYQF